ncbi:hypothetical protein [Bradyrhizobium sp.]|uniref:hypothetical protein n=1 Tax=Bradyrhizobium sp. TaxID=376 RepID=UPI003C769FB7
MIKWRFPSSAPRDGTPFVVKKSNGVLQNCFFDQEAPGFIIKGLVDAEKRMTPTLTDHVGWAPWGDLFEHLQDTGGDLDRQELRQARRHADTAIELLHWLACKSAPHDKETLQEVRSAIEGLLKIIPEGR